MITITDETKTYTMETTFEDLQKAYNFYYAEKERQRVKAKKYYKPREKKARPVPAQIVLVESLPV
jgi:hypothetical protein